jgi:hypothetical protein
MSPQQPTLIDTTPPPSSLVVFATAPAALAHILETLAPCYTAAQVAALCCSSPFRNNLENKILSLCPAATLAQAQAAMREAHITP